MTLTTFNNRVFGLDIFRAIAITTVVLVHGGVLLNNTRFSDFPYIPLVSGVDWFFVLSGFLIGVILLKTINQPEPFGYKDLFQFWKRRWFRTLPNYYLILVVNIIFVKYGVIKEDYTQFNWKFFFFLQNFSYEFMGFFWESWSLAVEEWFYIISPILLLLSLKFFPTKISFVLVTILMLIIPLIYRLSIRTTSIDGFWFDVKFAKVVVARLDSIAYGLLASWVFYYYGTVWVKYKVHVLVLGIVLTYFVLHYGADVTTFYRQIVCLSIGPFAASLFLPFAEGIKTGKGIFAKAITHISKISYSMYLVNLAVVLEVITTNFPAQGGKDGIIKYLIYWLVVIALSTIIYNYFEKPIMDLRDKRKDAISH